MSFIEKTKNSLVALQLYVYNKTNCDMFQVPSMQTVAHNFQYVNFCVAQAAVSSFFVFLLFSLIKKGFCAVYRSLQKIV